LSSKYSSTLDLEKMKTNPMMEGKDVNTFVNGYGEIKFKMNGDSSALAEKLQSHYKGFIALNPMFEFSTPKITSEGDYLSIGFGFPLSEDEQEALSYKKVGPIID